MFSQIAVTRSRPFFKKVTKNFVINKTCSLTAIFYCCCKNNIFKALDRLLMTISSSKFF